MDQEELEDYRQRLRERLNDLLKEANETVGDMHSGEGALFPDPVDRALLESNRSFTLRLRDRERKLIRKVTKALQRIDDGSFGICVECGEPIEGPRLKARPVTTLCIDCKEEQERLEKMEL